MPVTARSGENAVLLLSTTVYFAGEFSDPGAPPGHHSMTSLFFMGVALAFLFTYMLCDQSTKN